MKFITKDDDWGIRKILREIYRNEYKPRHFYDSLDNESRTEFGFNIFFNQFLPPTYYETQSTVLRHIDEIRNILQNQYKSNWVWIRRNGQYSCVELSEFVQRDIKMKIVELPTYLEIEEEKKRWQSLLGYRKEEGKSNPIKEELVQLHISKRR